MHVTLIHQPTAGDGDHSRDDLVGLFRAHGHTVRYRSKGEDGWADALDGPVDLVVAAGGDGTVSAVAARLAGSGTPLAVLALGTANNIAVHVGLCGRPDEVVPRLRRARPRAVDVGRARGPWGERLFVEGVGLGAFATAVAWGKAEKGGLLVDPDHRDETLDQDLRLLRAVLRDVSPRSYTLYLDGEEETVDGLLVEVRNVGYTGPNVALAPEADMGDGLLDVVLARAMDREPLVRHLSGRIDGEVPPPLDLWVRRARGVRLSSGAVRAHVDGSPWPPSDQPLTDGGAPVAVEVSVDPGALEVLVPA